MINGIIEELDKVRSAITYWQTIRDDAFHRSLRDDAERQISKLIREERELQIIEHKNRR